MAESVELNRGEIEAFFDYILGIEAEDDRYASPTRYDRRDGSVSALRFPCGPSQWLEVAVLPHNKEVRVGFVTGDAAIRDDIVEGLTQSGVTLQQFVEAEFSNAGLSWSQPPVELLQNDDGEFCFATSLTLEYLDDLDGDVVRDKTVRMLEGFLAAFAPENVLDGDDDENDEDS